jgi:chemotaxis regulatin CheY-phosphate phosphatase CheZ
MSKSKAAATASDQDAPALHRAETIDEREYRALETVLTQTARGRAFLREYLQRSGAAPVAVSEQPLPSADAVRILAAISDLHNAIAEQQSQPSVAHVRMDILEMARAISRTRAEIAAMRTQGSYDQLTVASEEMDAIVASTERATTDILQAAERIQEIAWQLREAGAEEALCETIDNCATDIYTACSFQDLTGQRTTKVVRVLQYLEARINSMVEIWGLSVGLSDEADAADVGSPAADVRPDAHLLNGPQMEADALAQDNIDELMGHFDAAEAAADDAFLAAGADTGDAAAADADAEAAADAAFAAAASGEPLAAGKDAAADMALWDGDEEIDEEKLKALFS